MAGTFQMVTVGYHSNQMSTYTPKSKRCKDSQNVQYLDTYSDTILNIYVLRRKENKPNEGHWKQAFEAGERTVNLRLIYYYMYIHTHKVQYHVQALLPSLYDPTCDSYSESDLEITPISTPIV